MEGWDRLGPVAPWTTWASQTSLRMWVGLYERWLDVGFKLPDPDDAREARRWLRLTAWIETVERRNDSNLLPPAGQGERVPMHRLGPGNDPATLEWATELLAMNLETYMALQLTVDPAVEALGGGLAKVKAPWPEVDGGEGSGAVQSGKNRRARMAYQAEHCIPVPPNHEEFFSQEQARTLLHDAPEAVLMFGEVRMGEATPADLRRMVHLMFALGYFAPVPEGEDADAELTEEEQRRHDQWSVALLRQYHREVSGVDKRNDDEGTEEALEKLRTRFDGAIHDMELLAQQGDGFEGPDYAEGAETDDGGILAAGADAGELYMPFVRKVKGLERWLIAGGAEQIYGDLAVDGEPKTPLRDVEVEGDIQTTKLGVGRGAMR